MTGHTGSDIDHITLAVLVVLPVWGTVSAFALGYWLGLRHKT
jgi:hypothetical protein